MDVDAAWRSFFDFNCPHETAGCHDRRRQAPRTDPRGEGPHGEQSPPCPLKLLTKGTYRELGRAIWLPGKFSYR